MNSPILLCTDGSDEALRALSAGLALLGRDHEFILVSVMDAPDEASLVGSGHAGAEMSVREYNEQVAVAHEAAQRAIEEAQNELRLVGAEVRIVPGKPGEAICHLASELSAEAVVVGSGAEEG